MTPSFILLSKVSIGGGFGALIVAIILIYWIYRKDNGEDLGCSSLLLLPLLPIIGLISLFGKLDKTGIEKEMNTTGLPYDGPFRIILCVLVVLSLIAVWILVTSLMVYYFVSDWWIWLWGIMMPLASINLYMLWQNVFFARLGRLHDRTAMIVCIVAVVLIVAFWVVAIPAYSQYTSVEFLSLYWRRKYSLE